MRTIKFKKCRVFALLGLLMLGLARLPGYGQDTFKPSTPYPIIFVHGIVGDQTTWTDNGEVDSFNVPIKNWDIVDFLQSGITPLKNGGFIDISLDYSRNGEKLNGEKENDVHVFTDSLSPADFYFVNFAVHAKIWTRFNAKENCSTIVEYSISSSNDRIKIHVRDPERFDLQDLVSIDEEIMQVSDKNGTELTLDRRKCGTVPSWHTSNIINPLDIFNLYKESNQAAIAKQGLGVKEAIQKVLDITHSDKVILVGHSMGGLAIREYIRTYFPQRQDVAKVVTIGTPFGGSNLAVLYKQYAWTVLGMDDRSDAIRDLKSGGDDFFSKFFWGNPNVYLFGGNEEKIPDRFYSKDVNCNGSINDDPPTYDDIYGVNRSQFPENVDQTWIVSTLKTDVAEFNHDGIVLNVSQTINDEDTIKTHAGHVSLIGNIYNLPGESKDIYALIRGFDEPDESELAYEIGGNSTNKGFITFVKHFDSYDFADRYDVDWFKVNISKKCLFKINLLASSYTGIWELDFYKNVNDDPVKSITDISQSIAYDITESGDYYIKIKGAPTLDGPEKHASYKYPYTLTTSIEDTPSSAMAVSPSSLQYYDVVIDAPKEKTVILTNNGSANILITGIGLAGADADQFTVTPMPPFTVTPELSQNLTVTFNPTSTGAKVATIEITTNSADIPTKTVSLKGNGTDHGTKVLVCNPATTYNFGDTKANVSRSKTFTIQNTGSNPCTISDLTIEGLNYETYSFISAPTVPFDLVTGQSKQITVKFSPTSIGSKSAILAITNNSDNISPKYSIDLYGNGTENYYSGSSNNIVAYEYWFDDQYQSKVKAPVTKQQESWLDIQVPTEGLINGLHSLHIRYKDQNGNWSAIASEFFQKLPLTTTAQNVVESEYWFDDNYASKVLAPVTPGQTILVNSSLEVGKLQNGLHSYHVRYKDDAGQWSSVVSEFFQKLPATNSGSRNIIVCEYWFDDNFAAKISTKVSADQTILVNSVHDVGSLQNGLHSYHVRYKDDAGQWSSVLSEFFQKLPAYTSTNNLITTYRYWFDLNEPDINTINLPEPVNPYHLIRDINISGLSNGDHYIHFQFRDSRGAWSSVSTTDIQNLNEAPVANAGIDQSVNEGSIVTLNGLNSSSPSGNSLTYKWTAPNGIVLSSPNEANPTFLATEVKKDSVLVFTLIVNDGIVDSYPSQVDITVMNVIKTSVEIAVKNNFKVYPNPVTNELTIELEGNMKRIDFEIINSLGQVVYTGSLFEKIVVPTTSFTPGMYVIKLKSGKTYEFKKFVKE